MSAEPSSWPLLSSLIVLPLLGAALILLLPRQATRSMARLSFVFLAGEAWLAWRLWRQGDYAAGVPQFVEHHPWIEPLGVAYHVGADGISLAMVMLTALITPLALAFAWPRLADRHALYAACVLLLQSALMGAFLALDLLLFYVFWELTLLPATFLVGLFGGERRIAAAQRFFLTTLAGSLLMLAAILVTAATYRQLHGSFSFELAELRRLAWPESSQTWLFIAFFVAFAIKLPIFPLHAWLPLTYTQASTGTTILLTALLSKLGAYGLLRIATPLFPIGSYVLGPSIAALGTCGIVYGGMCAWAHASGEGGGAARGDMQRLWAYVSLAHLGFLVLGLFSLDENGIEGAALHMVGHGVSAAAIFMLVGWWAERAGERRIGALSGLASRLPLFSLVFFFVALNVLGLPGTSGFVGEFLVLLGAFVSPALDPWSWWLVLGAGLGIVLAAVYTLQIVQRTLWGPLARHGVSIEADEAASEALALRDLGRRELLLVVPLLLGILWLGLAPATLLERIQPSVRTHLADLRARMQLVPESAPQLRGNTPGGAVIGQVAP